MDAFGQSKLAMAVALETAKQAELKKAEEEQLAEAKRARVEKLKELAIETSNKVYSNIVSVMAGDRVPDRIYWYIPGHSPDKLFNDMLLDALKNHEYYSAPMSFEVDELRWGDLRVITYTKERTPTGPCSIC